LKVMGFIVRGDIKPPHKGSLLVKWYKVVRIAEEVQTLGERGVIRTLSRLLISFVFLCSPSFHIFNTNLYVHSFIVYFLPTLSSGEKRYSSVGV
jgi:hypothetical protein